MMKSKSSINSTTITEDGPLRERHMRTSFGVTTFTDVFSEEPEKEKIIKHEYADFPENAIILSDDDGVEYLAPATLFLDQQMESLQNRFKNSKAQASRVIDDYKASKEYPKAIVSYAKGMMDALHRWMYSLSLAFSNLRVSTEKYIEENPLDSLGELTHEEKEIFQQFDEIDRLLDVNSEPTPEENEMFQLLDNMDKLLDNSHATKEDENSFGTGMGTMANRM